MDDINSEEITNFGQEDYFKNRLEDQIDWYDKKSIDTQKKYKRLKRTTIIASALIPIVSLATDFDTKFIVSFLGALITMVEGINSLNKYGDNWTRYRSICETLKSEKYMFLSRSGVYSEEESDFSYFVERIETIISQENINWASLNNEQKEEG